MPKATRASTHQNLYRASPIAIASSSSRPSYHRPQQQTYYTNITTVQSANMQSQSHQLQLQNQMHSSQLPSYATGGPVQHPVQNPYQHQSHHQQPHPSMPSASSISLRASSGAWNPADDNTLMQARAQGMNWAPIQAAYFPAKTPNACRKRHERLMDRRNSDDWETEKLERMAKEYMSIRKEMWSMLAERTGEKWAVVEAKCMTSGLKNLQSAARACARRERLESGGNVGAYHQPSHSYSTSADQGAYTDDSGIGLDDLDLDPEHEHEHEHEHGAENEYSADGSFDPRHHHQRIPPHHHQSHHQQHQQHQHQHPHSTGAYGVRPLGAMVGGGMDGGVGMRGSPATDDGSVSGSSTRGYDGHPGRGGYDMHTSMAMNQGYGMQQAGQGRVSSIDMGIGSIINRPAQGNGV